MVVTTVAACVEEAPSGPGDANVIDAGVGSDATDAPAGVVLLEITPTSRDLPVVEIGASVEVPFTVTNYGARTTQALDATLSAANDFAIVGNTCTTPGMNESCVVTLQPQPATIGAKSVMLQVGDGEHMLSVALSSPPIGTFDATVTIDAAPGGAETVDLHGQVLEHITFSVDPPGRDFGGVAVAATSTQTFSITNASAVTMLGPIGVIFTGATPQDFALQNDACSGQSVVPGASCSFDVVFTPAAPGPRSATLDLDLGPVVGHYQPLLAGTGLAAAHLAPGGRASPPNGASVARRSSISRR